MSIKEIEMAIIQLSRKEFMELRVWFEDYQAQLWGQPAEAETPADIDADEAWWDKKFADTSDSQLQTLIENVEAEIRAGTTKPMFDEDGEFIELLNHKSGA